MPSTPNSSTLHNTVIKAAVVISQTAIVDQAPDTTNDSAKDISLWDAAYDVLKKEQHGRIDAYESLLSMVLIRGKL